MKKNEFSLKTIDISLIACVIILIGVGFGFLYSASKPSGIKYYNNQSHYLIIQAIYLGIGVVLFLSALFIDFNVYKKYIKFFVIISILLLIATFIPGVGKEVGGAKRWITLKVIQFQPSEITKIVIIIYLSSVLCNKQEYIKDFYKGVLPPMILTGFVSILIFLEPDFSTTFLIIFLAILLFFLAGMRMVTFIMLITVGAISGAVMIFSAQYRAKRLLAFLNPWVDPLGTGWHYIQSMKCFALGKVFGVGIGESQQKNFALPEAHNDYIFAIIAEEGGIIFAVLIVILFTILAIIGFNIAKRCDDKYSFLLSSGITAMIFFQAMINIGVVVGVLPSTGITLPFVSSGGTSLIIFLFAVGVLLNISFKNRGANNEDR